MALFAIGVVVGAAVAAVGTMAAQGGGVDRVNVGPRIGDMKIQGSVVGTMIPILWGQHAIAGNLIWKSPVTEIKHESAQEVGGKGGGGFTVTNVWYSYHASLAFGICKGTVPVNGIKKIWANDRLIVDTDQDPLPSDIRFYTGSETQNPDPIIQSVEGIDNTPAYRGLCYIVFEDFDFSVYANQIPQFIIELEGI